MKLIHQVLSLKDLSPNQKTNSAFSNLVKLALSNKTNILKTTSKSQLTKLQKLCALSEYELEKYWSQKDNVTDFPYYQNYQDLTKLEWESFQGCHNSDHHHRQVLFVGGGPLPLTAIILAQNYNVNCTILDINPEANQLASRLKLNHKIKIMTGDAQNFSNYKDFEIIYLAALAGLNPKSKRAICLKIKQISKKGTHLIARSSWGNRRLLYQPLDQNILKLYKPILEVHPHNHIVNSFYILENL